VAATNAPTPAAFITFRRLIWLDFVMVGFSLKIGPGTLQDARPAGNSTAGTAAFQ
jgi:hypothetical protein